MRKFITILAASILILTSSAFVSASDAQKKVYILSLKTKVFASAAFDSNVLGTASRGNELNLVDVKGRWIMVEFQGGSGWVPAMVVGKAPPIDKVEAIQGSVKQLKHDARKRASATTTAGATRGLVSETRNRLGRDMGADYKALEVVESKSMDENEVWTFLKEMDAAR